MRKLLALFIIFLVSSSVAFAMPDNLYNKNNQTPIIYDASYNVALRNKLEADFHKKYTKKVNDNCYIDTSPLGAYGKEVLRPYALQKKPDDYKIISK